MTRRQTAIIAVLVVLVSTSAGAIAQDTAPKVDAPFVDRLLGLNDKWASVSTLDATLAAAKGRVDRYTGWTATKTNFGHEVSPEKELQRVQSFYNANNETFLRYANSRVNATGDHDVVNITFKYGGLEATRYLVADVEDGNYTSARIQASPSNIDSHTELEDGTYMVKLEDGSIEHRETLATSVDDTITLSGSAVDNAPEELRTLHERFIDPNRDVSPQYVIRVGAKYEGAVNSTLITGGETA